MKEIFDAVLLRLKSPILGLTTILYLIANTKWILMFFVETDSERILMIKDYSLDYALLLWCFLLSFMYSIAIDWFQLIIDYGVIKARELRKVANFNSQSRTARVAYRASKEYQEKLADKELMDWEKDKEELMHELKQITNRFNWLEGENRKTVDINLKIKEELSQSVYSNQKNQVLLTSLKNQVFRFGNKMGLEVSRNGVIYKNKIGIPDNISYKDFNTLINDYVSIINNIIEFERNSEDDSEITSQKNVVKKETRNQKRARIAQEARQPQANLGNSNSG